jgi:hypothetical protein
MLHLRYYDAIRSLATRGNVDRPLQAKNIHGILLQIKDQAAAASKSCGMFLNRQGAPRHDQGGKQLQQ